LSCVESSSIEISGIVVSESKVFSEVVVVIFFGDAVVSNIAEVVEVSFGGDAVVSGIGAWVVVPGLVRDSCVVSMAGSGVVGDGSGVVGAGVGATVCGAGVVASVGRGPDGVVSAPISTIPSHCK
jgi:hypothetical protein